MHDACIEDNLGILNETIRIDLIEPELNYAQHVVVQVAVKWNKTLVIMIHSMFPLF